MAQDWMRSSDPGTGKSSIRWRIKGGDGSAIWRLETRWVSSHPILARVAVTAASSCLSLVLLLGACTRCASPSPPTETVARTQVATTAFATASVPSAALSADSGARASAAVRSPPRTTAGSGEARLTEPCAKSGSPKPTREKIEAEVRRIVKEQLEVKERNIKLASKFVDDLGADSLGMVELLLAFEEAFQLDIPDEDTAKMCTVGDAVDYIRKRCQAE